MQTLLKEVKKTTSGATAHQKAFANDKRGLSDKDYVLLNTLSLAFLGQDGIKVKT